MNDLWTRLKQRKLVQWAVAYIAAAFALLQGVDIIAQRFAWPDSIARGLIIVSCIGFFVTLLLAWYHGERGAQKVSGTELLILALVLVLGGGFLWKFTPGAPAPIVAAETTPVTVASAPVAVAEKSIAVLPFAVLSNGDDDALFADGLSEEIINSLSRVPDLQVAARSSSFALRDSGLSGAEIAGKLHVAHVLEGSIRRAGDRLRISTQLIRASDGINVWTENYDRSNQDIIAIQEDVARSIAQALRTVTDPKSLAAMQRIGTRSVPAYDAFLKGLALRGKASETGDYGHNVQALSAFDQAISLDPEFAEAHLAAINLVRDSLDSSAFNAASTLRVPYSTRLNEYRRRLDQATAHIRDPAMVSYLQSLRALVDLRFADALRLTQDYLSAHPESVEALIQASNVARVLGKDALARELVERLLALASEPRGAANAMTDMTRLHDNPRAVAMAREGMRRFPDNADVAYQAQRVLLSAGKVSEASRLVPALLASGLDASTKLLVQMRQACGEGRRHDAEVAFQTIDRDDPDWSNQWHGLLLLGRDDEAVRIVAKYDQPDRMYSIWPFLSYNKFDVSRAPNLRAALEAQGIKIRPPSPEPYNCKPEAAKP